MRELIGKEGEAYLWRFFRELRWILKVAVLDKRMSEPLRPPLDLQVDIFMRALV